MKSVILDFEFNVIGESSVRKKCGLSREIIEFGAVMLDEDLKIVREFQCFTRPQFGTLTNKCTELTGITIKQVGRAQLLEECLCCFLDWLGEIEDVCIYTWSDADHRQLVEECEVKHIYDTRINAILNNWHDLQAEFSDILGVKRKYGLSTALEEVGLPFSGIMHDALDDARNTAELFVLTQEPDEIIRRINTVTYVEEEPLFTLGDIFKHFQLAVCV